MVHATAHILIAAFYLATLCGLDKSIAVGFHAAIYLLMGVVDLVARLGLSRFGRWVALIGLMMAFQFVEVVDPQRADALPVVVFASSGAARGASH